MDWVPFGSRTPFSQFRGKLPEARPVFNVVSDSA